MAKLCPLCGRSSQDVEFCDHCNSDLSVPQIAEGMPTCPLGGNPVSLTSEQWHHLVDPESFVVLFDGVQARRVHWVSAGRRDTLKDSLQRRASIRLSCLPEVVLGEDALGTWVIAAHAEPYEPWLETHSFEAMGSVSQMLHHARAVSGVMEELHAHGLVWANFDPQALQRDKQRRLQITNLDLRVYEAGTPPDDLRVLPRFVAPEIIGAAHEELTPRSDVFHLALFLYYWQAGVLPDGLCSQGLEAFDYQFPPLRVYCPQLPEGIAAVLERGLALAPSARPATPNQLCDELAEELDRCRARRGYAGALTWEIGKHTRTGRCKEAQHKANEDHVLACSFDDPPRALLAVADGISLCDVGSGALASFIVTMMVENSFDATAHASQFEERMSALAVQGANTLLEWARERGQIDRLARGGDLMGTTLTVAWIEGREVRLANLGDSRAYLLSGDVIDQLTVDGDLGTELLQNGRAPEEVAELGPIAKALRQCIGGSKVDDEGNVVIFAEACKPSFTRFPVMPGDILVLCTDGLVEEGAFLSPKSLLELRDKHPDASPQQLAEFFAEAADALQSIPSPLEPDGFGDNISCIVVQFKEMAPSLS